MATINASTPIWVPVRNAVTLITVRIFCHVERLGPVYDAGWVHFSLNLSAAFDTGTNPVTPDDVRKYLRLWKWDWSQLAILGIDDQNKTVVFAPSDVTLLLDQAPPPLASLDPALSSEMEDAISIDSTLKAFQSDSVIEGKTVDKKTRNWKGFLAHVSTFPAPLPQSLKLCVFFRVSQQAIDAAKATEIVAAPSAFGTAGPFPNRGPQLPPTGQPWDVTDQTLPLHRVIATNTPDYYFWAYDTTTAPTVTAYLNRCPTAAPSSDSGSFMNLANMWVTKPTPLASGTTGALPLSEDWTLQLESKCADAFDFPRRLLDALQSNIQSLRDKGKLLWPVDNSFHECFLASLRDLANFGLATPPEGRTLAEAVVAYLKGPVDEIKSILTAGEAQSYRDVASWIKRLKDDFLRAVEPGTQFPEVPSTSHPEFLPAYARALEHLYSVLAGDSLVDFFLMEWDSVLKTHPFWQQKPQIAKRLTDIQLRKRLALGNCGIAWRSFTGNLHERDALFNALKTALRSYFSERFGGSGTTEYKTYFPPVTSKLAPEIQTFLDAFAADFVDEVLLPQEPTANDPATLTEDLTVQVDRLQRAQASGSSDDQSDFLRRIAGLGVLLRRKGTTAWRCLSLAQLNIATKPSGLDPSPVPLRLGYRNGLRQCYLTYRNQPMAATSPAADFSQNHEMIDDDDGKIPLLSYTNPYSTANGLSLEGLVYRPIDSPYEAAVFLMGNAGHLPSELAAQDRFGRKIPWSFRSTFASATPPFIQEIPYVRRVPVGLVRLGSTIPRGQSEMEKLALPPIPDSVLPLTRSLHLRQSDAQKDREDALILLTPSGAPWLPNKNTFKFVVRPPSTTLPVWDRWVALDSSKRGMRVNVWARYHELADVPDAVSKAVKSDIALDDPAVNQIRFQFTQIYPTPGATQTVDCPVGATAGDCSSDLMCVQSPPLQVEVSSSTTLTIPNACSNPLRIGIPPGQVWKLEILPIIQDPTRFHPALASAVGKPVTLYIEIAAPLVEGTASDLRRLLNGALQLGFAKERLQVSLKPTASSPMWDRMHRVELMLQRWRWDGRPVCYFDWDQDNKPRVHYGLPPGTRDLEQQDGTLFASRESSDHLSLPSRVDFAATKQTENDIYQTDLSTLPGALYFRAAIRVFSRYEGLLTSGELRDSIDSRPSPTSQAEQWQRILVPCRYQKSVPRPVVKLVLPLTQATPASALSPDMVELQPGDAAEDPTALATSVTSGLIVILDESWYSDSLGGIGETFEWDIVRTALPDVPDDSRLEFGPDPILDLTEDPFAGRTVQSFPAIGAIGYTYDTDTLAPLFTRASFVLPPPTVDGIPDLSWFFLKLRFRRRLALAPLLMSDTSDWTEPVWTQLLPPSNLIDVEGQTLPLDVSRLYLDSNPSHPAFRDQGANGKPEVKPKPRTGGGQCVFELWVLLTRQIVDALGRRNQESFVNIVRLDNISQLLPMPGGSVIRLIEIQRRSNTTINNFKELIEGMFPDTSNPAADPADTKARIVRVFTPISVTTQ